MCWLKMIFRVLVAVLCVLDVLVHAGRDVCAVLIIVVIFLEVFLKVTWDVRCNILFSWPRYHAEGGMLPE